MGITEGVPVVGCFLLQFMGGMLTARNVQGYGWEKGELCDNFCFIH